MSNPMLYSQDDRVKATAERAKRRFIVLAPGIAMLLVAVASFVWFRVHRNTDGWIVTALITVLGGAYMIFLGDVYLRPVSLYKQHVDYMLDGRTRETVGILTAVDDRAQDKDGLDCYALTVNIGTGKDPNDDRLFYMDAFKGLPDAALGTLVRVTSNNRMVASFEPVLKES